MAPYIVLITGANRGLGLGLAKRYLAEPNHVLIAAVRDPSHPTVKDLSSLPRGQGTKLLVVQYDAAVEQSPFDAVTSLRNEHSIEHLDVVVANAAIAQVLPLVKDARRTDILEHLNVNVLGVVSLYQATRDLLQKASVSSGKAPVFAIMGSTGGSLARQPPVPNAVYGASKSMVHWYGVKIALEDPWLSVPVIDPDWVQTDMGNAGAVKMGLEEAPTKIDVSLDGVYKVLTDPDSRTKFGGKMVHYTGDILAW